MATFRKRGGRWQVQVRRSGHRPISNTFTERTLAEKWARDIESHIDKGTFLDTSVAQKTTVEQAIQRYVKDILPTKRGWHVEIYRTKTLTRYLGGYNLAQLQPHHIARYRDHRLNTISPASVKRELVILSRIMTLAMKDWGIPLPHGNPVSQITIANGDVQRTRRLTKEEEQRLMVSMSGNAEIQTIVRIALETAMRRSEILRITKDDVDLDRSVLHIPVTKTNVPRSVPLSVKAKSALRDRLRALQRDSEQIHAVGAPIFHISPSGLSHAFLNACRINPNIMIFTAS